MIDPIPEHIREQFEKAQTAYLNAMQLLSEQAQPQPSGYEVISQWARWWLLYFQENADFRVYCCARRARDMQTCAALEVEFSRIRELYEDWGDIDLLPPLGKSAWKKWFDAHADLFVKVPEIRLASDVAQRGEGAGVLVTLPKGLAKPELLRLFAAFVDQHYEFPSTRTDAQIPKYSLYAPKGKLDKSTLAAVEKAYWMNRIVNAPLKDAPLSLSQTVFGILDNDSDLGFDWKLSNIDESRRRSGTFKNTDLARFKPLVIRHKAHYKAYVANTIHGIFPKKDE